MNTKDTIAMLQAAGYAVRIKHKRPILVPIVGARALVGSVVQEGVEVDFGTRRELDQLREQDTQAFFAAKGGVTEAVIEDASGLTAARGRAYCRLDDGPIPGDQFNRKLGARIALGRAVKKLLEEEEVPW